MPRRAMRSDWGSVTEIERGKRYRLRYWAETPQGYRRVSETVRGTRRDAYDVLAQRRLDHSQDAPCSTVGEAWRTWAEPSLANDVENGDRALRTLRQNSDVMRLYVLPRWGDVPLDKVTALGIQQWVSDLSQAQAGQSLSMLRQVMRYGCVYGYVSANPCDAGIRLPSKSTVKRRDSGTWDSNGLGEVWRACYGSWFECAVLLSAFGSCRVGESLGPMADDVERVGDVTLVWVVRQVSRDTGVTNRLKNSWSKRAVVVPGPMGLRLWQLSQDGRTWLTGNGLGEPTSQKWLTKSFGKALTDAGVERHPAKNLRPSWETWMHWELRVPQDVIERLMGHVPSGSRVTAVHYDRPRWVEMAGIVSDCYTQRPSHEKWSWLPPELMDYR